LEEQVINSNKPGFKGGKQDRNRVNEQIKSPTVLLINAAGDKVGETDTRDALQLAREAALDLVEIQPNSKPPVAKIMDYGKFLFQQKKKKKKPKELKLKEVKFRPVTDIGDYEVKLRNLRGFLDEGNKVKITVWFKGREMSHQELGRDLLEKIKADLEALGKVEFFPKLEGKQLIMIMAPKK
jgi:translation initiation factor IF-3